VRTGQLSAKSGVKLETIRYYERVGLLPAPPRSAAGYREYQVDHLQRLIFLRRSRQLGFSIEEIRDLLRLANEPSRVCDDVSRLAAAHLSSVKSKARELQRLQLALERLVSSCPASTCATKCTILEALGGSDSAIAVQRRQTKALR
jgi:MerR family mercuric resistance operon transcriptional regulator